MSVVIFFVLMVIIVLHPYSGSLGFSVFDVLLFLQIFGWLLVGAKEKIFVRVVVPLLLVNLLNLVFWVPIVPGCAYAILVIMLDRNGCFQVLPMTEKIGGLDNS